MKAWALPCAAIWLASASPCAARASDLSGGIFSLHGREDRLNYVPELDSPYVAELSVNFAWKDLEPEPGRYDWSRLEKAHDVASAKRKRLMIRVTAGWQSPPWIYERGVRSISFNGDETNFIKPGVQTRMPVPWEAAYLKAWEGFLLALGRKIRPWRNLYCVQMSGGGFIGEMHLPKKRPETLAQWRAAGISDEKLIAMWRRIILAYDRRMPSRVGLALDLGIPFPGSRAPRAVYDWALRELPGRVWFQQDGLHAGMSADSEWSRMIRAASVQTMVGYQLLGGGRFLDSQTGDRRKAFARAVQDGCAYVEVYRDDLLDPRWRDAVAFLAQGLTANLRSRRN